MTCPGRITALVPATGLEEHVAPCVRSLLADGVEDVRVVVWAARGRDDLRELRGVAGLPGRRVAGASYAAAMNRALAETEAEVVLVVVPVVRVRPGLVSAYLARLRGEAAGVVYGDYEAVSPGAPVATRVLLATPEDLCESSSFGYVRAYRRRALAAIGGWDESLVHADDYDLRLRLGEVAGFAHAGEARYEVALPGEGPARTATLAALGRYFTAESTAPAGYGYLFLAGDVEGEVERVFQRCLERRNARLAEPPAAFACPHHAARPTVSVVIPTLNRAAMLERAIATVREGSFADFEIVVVDNGSSDATVALVEAIRRQDPRVVLLHNPRGSIASALNLGVRAARGKYVSQLDSDDEYVPATLATQVAHLEANPSWALAVSYYDVIDEHGCALPQYGIVRHLEYDRDNILRTGGAGAVRTWHRCVIESLGGFDEEALESYAEDYDLVLRLAERFEVGRVHQVLYRVRLHATNTDKQLDPRYRALRKAEARRRALERRRAANRHAMVRGAS